MAAAQLISLAGIAILRDRVLLVSRAQRDTFISFYAVGWLSSRFCSSSHEHGARRVAGRSVRDRPKRLRESVLSRARDVQREQRVGGPDMKTLFITGGDTIYKVRTDIPGLLR